MNVTKTTNSSFLKKHPEVSKFLKFFLVSNGVTILQFILMILLKNIFEGTKLVDIGFQVLPVGNTTSGGVHYIFNYAAGAIQADGTGGGFAYFLAVQLAIGIAQIANFFLQRKVTFKHSGKAWKAAIWYFVAYVLITIAAGAAQGVYKKPIYSTMIAWWGAFGENIADVLTMFINSIISFWVFYPIFKVIFNNKNVVEE